MKPPRKSFIAQFVADDKQCDLFFAIGRLIPRLRDAIQALEDYIVDRARIITKHQTESPDYNTVADIFDLHWLLTKIANGQGRCCSYSFNIPRFLQCLDVCITMAFTFRDMDQSKDARLERGKSMLEVAKQLTLHAATRPRSPIAYRRVLMSILLNRQMARMEGWVDHLHRTDRHAGTVLDADLFIGTCMNPQALLGISLLMMVNGYEPYARSVKATGNQVSWKLIKLTLDCLLVDEDPKKIDVVYNKIMPDSEALSVFYDYVRQRPGYVNMLRGEGRTRGVRYVPDFYDVCQQYPKSEYREAVAATLREINDHSDKEG